LNAEGGRRGKVIQHVKLASKQKMNWFSEEVRTPPLIKEHMAEKSTGQTAILSASNQNPGQGQAFSPSAPAGWPCTLSRA
jgi:hypothetical protein